VRFISLIVKNVLHRPVRTVLTTLGLAIAIAAVTILVGISWNFERSFLAIYNSKGIDLVVVHAGSSNQLSSSLNETMADRLRQIPGVADVAPSLVDTVGFEQQNLVSVLINGWVPGSLLFRGLRVLDGRALQPDDDKAVMLGRVLTMTLGKKAGDRLQIAGETFDVVGIFESDSWFENGGLLMPLKTLQKMMGREGQVTGFLVRASKSDERSIAELRKRIETTISGVAATPARDHVQGDTQIRLSRAMAWTTAAVALFLGSVGMLNTMLMSIFERTREIGILRAVGWRRRRVLGLIMGEALAIALIGTVVGVLLAVVGLRAITLAPTARGFINPDLPPQVLLIALAMGIGLSMLGGLYPAARAAALEPTEALRYE
jgi:putative ABC transport system permease protein